MAKTSLIIVSGGMDSVVLLHDRQEEIALAVSFVYGSKHNGKEIRCAQEQCRTVGVEHLVLHLPFIGDLFRSALLKSGGEIPDGHYEDESMKKTVVPFRNGIMLSVAAGIADSRGLKRILIGSHSGDHAIYPDCRPEFTETMSRTINLGTYSGLTVSQPYGAIDKRAIGLIGHRLGVDFSKTWTCYRGGELHCGTCGACVERREALEGFDPTAYRASTND